LHPQHAPCAWSRAAPGGPPPVRQPQAQRARHVLGARQRRHEGHVVQLATKLGVDEAVEVRVQVQVAPAALLAAEHHAHVLPHRRLVRLYLRAEADQAALSRAPSASVWRKKGCVPRSAQCQVPAPALTKMNRPRSGECPALCAQRQHWEADQAAHRGLPSAKCPAPAHGDVAALRRMPRAKCPAPAHEGETSCAPRSAQCQVPQGVRSASAARASA